MTAASAAAAPAYDNPLMPNAKLREMYSAMLRVRADLKQRRTPARRNGAAGDLRGLEACLVSPVIDLGAEDMVVSAQNVGGSATRPPVPKSGEERLWAAAGAAAALQSKAARSKGEDGAVLVCYARAKEATPAAWARVLAHLSANRLPLLFVLLPDGGAQATSVGKMSSLALRSRVPGIPVDQHDAVALYRVAQESIGHARIGGGGALIECVRYVLQGEKSAPADAVTALAQYMLARQVANRRWLDSQAKSARKRTSR